MSEKDKYKKKTVCFSILGMVLYGVMCCVGFIHGIIRNVNLGEERIQNALSSYQAFTIIAVVFGFYPLVLIINFCAKKAEMKIMSTIAKCLSIFLTVLVIFIIVIWTKGMFIIER